MPDELGTQIWGMLKATGYVGAMLFCWLWLRAEKKRGELWKIHNALTERAITAIEKGAAAQDKVHAAIERTNAYHDMIVKIVERLVK